MSNGLGSLGLAVNEMRRLRNLSLAELAKRSGLTVRCIRLIERGQVDGRSFADALAKGLGCDAEQLRRGEGVEACCDVLTEIYAAAPKK